MKKILTSILFLLFFTGTAIADVPPGFQLPWDVTYQVKRTVLITNLGDFPELVLLQFNYNNGALQVKEVKNNESLEINSSYSRSADSRVLAIKKTTLEKAGGIQSIDWDKVLEKKNATSIYLSNYIKGNSSLKERVYKYKVKASGQENITLELTDVTLKYNNGTDRVFSF